MCLWNWLLSFATCLVSNAIDSAWESLFWDTLYSSMDSSFAEVRARLGFLVLVLSSRCNSNIRNYPNSSSSFISYRSLASSIVVTFMLNFDGKDLRTFRTSFQSDIFFPSEFHSLAMSSTRTLNSIIVSSSVIWSASKWDVRIYNREIFTFEVPSKATSKISHATLPDLEVFISLNMFRSTTLNSAFSARELPTATSSSMLVHFSSDFHVTFSVSSFLVGCSHSDIMALQHLISRDIRNAFICDFQ